MVEGLAASPPGFPHQPHKVTRLQQSDSSGRVPRFVPPLHAVTSFPRHQLNGPLLQSGGVRAEMRSSNHSFNWSMNSKSQKARRFVRFVDTGQPCCGAQCNRSSISTSPEVFTRGMDIGFGLYESCQWKVCPARVFLVAPSHNPPAVAPRAQPPTLVPPPVAPRHTQGWG